MKKNSAFVRGIDLKVLQSFFLILTIESIFSFLVLLSLPKSVDNAWLFGYSFNRMALIFGMGLISMGLGGFALGLWKKSAVEERLLSALNSLLCSEKKLEIVLNIFSFFFLQIVFLLVLWAVTKDRFYLAYLTRFGPIIVFAALFVMQTMYLLLLSYSETKKIQWYWSLFLGGVLVLLQEWALVVNNKIGNLFLVCLLLFTAFYVQSSFRRNFNRSLWGSWFFAVIFIWLLIYLEFLFIPKRFLVYKSIFLTFTPLLMMTLSVSADIFYGMLSRVRQSFFVRLVVFAFVLFVFIYAGRLYYTIGVTHAEQVNTTYEGYDDELAYIQFAIYAKETGFRFTGTRNQMPIYPYVQALFYRPGMTPDELFIQGKQVNIWLSLLALNVLFFVVWNFLSLSETINLILITAFGLYALKSGYFMAELLYYTFSFSAFLGMCLLLIKPSLKLSLVTGILLGIGHLTKASILPGFLLFIGVFGFKYLVSYIQTAKSNFSIELLKDDLKNFFLVIFCFLVTISPYILESKEVYGSYFYNVNSTFYMWYDSYDEATNGTIAHGDGYGWPDMPADEIPSPGKYFREHNLADIVERIRYGLHWQVENITYQYSFFNYPIFLFAAFLLTFLLNLKIGIHLLRENWALVLFTFLYLMAYFSLYVWYSAISSMSRFLFALYLPLVFALFVAVKKMTGGLNLPFVKIANILMLLMVVIDIWYLVSYGPFFRDFGS